MLEVENGAEKKTRKNLRAALEQQCTCGSLLGSLSLLFPLYTLIEPSGVWRLFPFVFFPFIFISSQVCKYECYQKKKKTYTCRYVHR